MSARHTTFLLAVLTASIGSFSAAAAEISVLPAGAVARLADDRLRHADRPTALVFLPDGRTLVSGGQDGVVRSWDSATGQMRKELVRAGLSINALDLVSGGRQLAVSFGTANLQLLDPETLKQTGSVSAPQHEQAALSADDKYLAFVTNNQEVRLLERGNGLPMLDLPMGRRVAFRPDSKAVAVGGADGNVEVFLIAGGKQLMKVRHGNVVSALAFRADGAVLVMADNGEKPRVKAWQVGRDKPLVELEASGPIAFVGNDRLAVVRGGRVGIWDFVREKWALEIPVSADVLAVSPDGKLLATAGTGHRIQLWDLESGRPRFSPQSTLPGARLLIPAKEGRLVVGVGETRTIWWPLGQEAAADREETKTQVVAAAAGAGRLALATTDDVQIFNDFDPVRRRRTEPIRVTDNARNLRAIDLSPDGRRLAFGGSDSKIAVADPATGRIEGLIPTSTATLALALDPAGNRLAGLGRDGFLRLWSLAKETGAEKSVVAKELWKLRIQRSARGAVRWHPDGALLAVSESARVSIVDAVTGKARFHLDRNIDDGTFLDIAFSADGRFLGSASAGEAGAVQVWELATRSLVKRFMTQQGAATRVAFSADGRRLFSADDDEGITVWDATGRDGAPPPTDADLKNAVRSLDTDAPSAMTAAFTLIAGGKRSLPPLEAALRKNTETRARIKTLIAQLDADDYAIRDAASRDLQALNNRALSAIEAAAENATSTEARQRAASVRDALARRGVRLPDHGLSSGDLQLLRMIHVLERIGGAEANKLLRSLSSLGGAVGPEAAAAVKRVEDSQ